MQITVPSHVHHRWRRKGVWEKLLEILIDEPDYEWLMIDASHIKVHPPRSGSERGQTGYVQDKRGLNTKMHLAVDAHGMPVRILVTEGTRADCKEAVHLIEGISAETLPADRSYDSNDILAYALSAGMEPVIPPKKNHKEQRGYDKYLYKLRHLVEICFLSLKRWRGIATRYAKTSDAFIAAVHVRCIAIWVAIRT